MVAVKGSAASRPLWGEGAAGIAVTCTPGFASLREPQSATPPRELLQDFREAPVRNKNRRAMPAVFQALFLGLEVRRACRMGKLKALAPLGGHEPGFANQAALAAQAGCFEIRPGLLGAA